MDLWSLVPEAFVMSLSVVTRRKILHWLNRTSDNLFGSSSSMSSTRQLSSVRLRIGW